VISESPDLASDEAIYAALTVGTAVG